MREKKKNTFLSKKEEKQRQEKIEFIKLVQKKFAEEKAKYERQKLRPEKEYSKEELDLSSIFEQAKQLIAKIVRQVH